MAERKDESFEVVLWAVWMVGWMVVHLAVLLAKRMAGNSDGKKVAWKVE